MDESKRMTLPDWLKSKNVLMMNGLPFDPRLKAFSALSNALANAARQTVRALTETLVPAMQNASASMARFSTDLICAIDLENQRKGMTPRQRYAAIGYPYGKNSKGKKRWLLMMKHRRKAKERAQ